MIKYIWFFVFIFISSLYCQMELTPPPNYIPSTYSTPTNSNIESPDNKFVAYNTSNEIASVLADYYMTINNIPSGIYYYRIITDTYTSTKKMVLVK